MAAEDQAKRRKAMTMEMWDEKLDAFLSFNERELLTHAGTIKATVAQKIAEERYEQFDSNRRKADAEKADTEDIKEIEKMVKKLEKQKHD